MKFNSNYLLLTFFLMSFSFASFSQNTQSENEEDLISSQIITQDFQIRNSAAIIQIGNQNNASIIQNGNNSTFINQVGNRNTGYVNQIGIQNQGGITQFGNRNQSYLWLKGSNLQVASRQIGNNNEINSFTESQYSSPKKVTLNQLGSNNEMEVALIGSEFFGASLFGSEFNQIGSGHSLSALVENPNSSIRVTQTPGVGGQGMRLSISNTTFNFPGK